MKPVLAELEQTELRRQRTAENDPTVGQVLSCAALIVMSVVLGAAGAITLAALVLVVLVVGGFGGGLVLVAVSLWGRAG